MKCPFPGMDPYLERPAIWPDFHDSLITYIREVLQPRLRPKYAALTQDRLYVVESERPIYPDVTIVRQRRLPRDEGGVAVAEPQVLEADAAIVIRIEREAVRQPYIQILEPGHGGRVVTVIEVLSPDNKRPGPGRDSYLRKRDELWQSGTQLVEIDLLSEGESTVRLSVAAAAEVANARYLVAVSRLQPLQLEFYPIGLRQRLPKVNVPLAIGDGDAVLDLPAAFARCWDAGPYPEVLRYDEPPAVELTPDDGAWVTQQLRPTVTEGKGR